MSNISKAINFKENLFGFFRISILRATNFMKGSNLYDPWLTYQYSALFFISPSLKRIQTPNTYIRVSTSTQQKSAKISKRVPILLITYFSNLNCLNFKDPLIRQHQRYFVKHILTMSGAVRQTPLSCSGHTRPVVHLSFSKLCTDGYFLISACKGLSFRFWFGIEPMLNFCFRGQEKKLYPKIFTF